jgi:hypothetical protein
MGNAEGYTELLPLHADATTIPEQRLFREAERWLLSNDCVMFSFENVCTVLDIDSETCATSCVVSAAPGCSIYERRAHGTW